MESKRILKIPALPLFILKMHYQKLFFQCSTADTSIIFLNQGVQISSHSELALDSLLSKFSEILSKMSYHKPILTKTSKKKFFGQCPSLLADLGSKDCKVTLMDECVYVSSMTKTPTQIEQIIQKYVNVDVWTMPFKNPNHVNPLYNEIVLYFNRLLACKSDFLLIKMKVRIEINVDESHFFIYGCSETRKLQSKEMLKEIIYATCMLQFKLQIDVKQVTKYLNKVSDHPIVLTQVLPGVFRIVTKINVMLQLLSAEKFLKYTKIQENNAQIGIFLFEDSKYGYKRNILEVLALQNHLFIEEKHSFIYFTNSFEDPDNCGSLKTIKIALKKLIDMKPENPWKTKKSLANEKLQANSKKFYFLQERHTVQHNLQFCQMFGCDVIVQKVYLNSDYLGEYYALEESEIIRDQLFTVEDQCKSDKTKVVTIVKGKMKGEYFFGQIKQKEERRMYLPELFITVIKE